MCDEVCMVREVYTAIFTIEMHSRYGGGGRIARCVPAVHKVCTGSYPSCICLVPITMSLVMYLYELLACFALISSVLVCVVLHPFL